MSVSTVRPLPQAVKDALLAGGSNTSFHFYSWNESKIAAAYAELPKMAAAGVRHIRILLSQNSIELGTSGALDMTRYAAVVKFAIECKRLGMLPIIDVHNTGIIKLLNDDGTVIKPIPTDWTDDYMWGIRHPALATRHRRVLIALASALRHESALQDWCILTPANEPIYVGGSVNSEPSIWYEYQKLLMAELRAAWADGIFTVVANDWNGIEATIYTLSKNMPFWDERMIVDCHFYEPLEDFTHDTSDPGSAIYPGVIPTWRTKSEKWAANRQWNKDELDRLIKMLADWRDKDPRHPFCMISEFGTSKYVDSASRLRYTQDLVEIFRKYGIGYTVYTWNDNQWSLEGRTDLYKALWQTPPVPPEPEPEPQPEPEPDLLLKRLEALEYQATTLKKRVSDLESADAARSQQFAEITAAITDLKDRLKKVKDALRKK